MRIMVKKIKWTNYLWLSLLSFGAFMLEYLSIFVIEVNITKKDFTTMLVFWSLIQNRGRRQSVFCSRMR